MDTTTTPKSYACHNCSWESEDAAEAYRHRGDHVGHVTFVSEWAAV